MPQRVSLGVDFARSNGLWIGTILQRRDAIRRPDSIELCGAESRDTSRRGRLMPMEYTKTIDGIRSQTG